MPHNVEMRRTALGLVPYWTAVFTDPSCLSTLSDDTNFTYICLSRHEFLQSLASDRHVIRMDKRSPSIRGMRSFFKGETGHASKGLGEPFDCVCVVRLDTDGIRVIRDHLGDNAIALFTFLQHSLRSLVLGNVTIVDDDGLYARLGQQVLSHRFYPSPGAVLVLVAKLRGNRNGRFLQDLAEAVRDRGQVRRVDQLKGVTPHVLPPGTAEHTAARRTDV